MSTKVQTNIGRRDQRLEVIVPLTASSSTGRGKFQGFTRISEVEEAYPSESLKRRGGACEAGSDVIAKSLNLLRWPEAINV